MGINSDKHKKTPLIIARLIFAQKLVQIRRKANLSFFKAAKLAKISPIVLFHYEWGFKDPPGYIISRLLGKIYNASEEDIFYFCSFLRTSMLKELNDKRLWRYLSLIAQKLSYTPNPKKSENKTNNMRMFSIDTSINK